MGPKKGSVSSAVAAALVCASPAPAFAQTNPWRAALSTQYTADIFSNTSGGLRRGTRYLHKAELILDATGSLTDLDDLHVFVDVGHINGVSLSAVVGDAQGVSGIESFNGLDVFEAWVAKSFPGAAAELRAGLLDLNASFDTQDVGALFVNSSHGMGAEFSHSGVTGPSTYPLVAPGVIAEKVFGSDPNRDVTFRLGIVGGAPGNPERPDHFAIRFDKHDGLLLAAQSELGLGPDASFQVGAWQYSSAQPVLDAEEVRSHGDNGAYGRLEGPLGKIGNDSSMSAWLRAGFANSRFNAINTYLGGGLIVRGIFSIANSDEFGVSVANAGFSQRSRKARELVGHAAKSETTFEATYRSPEWHGVAFQPDLQLVHEPSGDRRIHDALVVGLRIAFKADLIATPAKDPN